MITRLKSVFKARLEKYEKLSHDHFDTMEMLISHKDELLDEFETDDENHPNEQALMAIQRRINIEMEIGDRIKASWEEANDVLDFIISRQQAD